MRACMYEPIPEVFEAARLLSLAVDAHFVGDRSTARRLFAAADIPAIRTWQWPIQSRRPWKRLPSEPASLQRGNRAVPRMPTKQTCAIVLHRDGHHCRFCGMPVISTATRKALSQSYSEVIQWTDRFETCHAAFQCLWLNYDHILPNERGGTSDPDNIVITCAPCNYGRMNFTLEEVGVGHPLSRAIVPRWEGHQTWDGLTRFR